MIRTLLYSLLLFVIWCSFACTPTVRFTRDGALGRVHTGNYTPNFVVVDSSYVMDCLKEYENTPYKWGGIDKSGIDCSGLVQAVYRDCARVSLPRKTDEQVDYGTRVDRNYLRGGDLLFFRIKKRKIDHVGIYVGNGIFVHASTTGGVRRDSLDDEYFDKRFVVAKRLFFE